MAESGEPKKDFLTVGIGASAGGLSVLKTVLRSVPGRCGMAFVVVQHLDPTHESMLSELLDRDSALPVKNAEQGQQVEAEHVYVIPPDTYLEVCDGVLRLTEPTDRRGFRRSIDHFFVRWHAIAGTAARPSSCRAAAATGPPGCERSRHRAV